MTVTLNCSCGAYLSIEEYGYNAEADRLAAAWMAVHPHEHERLAPEPASAAADRHILERVL